VLERSFNPCYNEFARAKASVCETVRYSSKNSPRAVSIFVWYWLVAFGLNFVFIFGQQTPLNFSLKEALTYTIFGFV